MINWQELSPNNVVAKGWRIRSITVNGKLKVRAYRANFKAPIYIGHDITAAKNLCEMHEFKIQAARHKAWKELYKNTY